MEDHTTMEEHLWRIELLGGLSVRRDAFSLNRFRTQKTGALLAFLAYHLGKSHQRDSLVELLWRDDETASARNSLSVALSSIRRDMESQSGDGSVIVSDRFSVGLNSKNIVTDVAEFESALREAESLEGAARIVPLTRAVDLYRGPLLPDFDEEWIAHEARRLEEAYFRALRRLVVALRKQGEVTKAIHFAERGVAIDPSREEAQRDLVQLYAVTGQLSAARRQFAQLEHQLALNDATPTAATRQIMAEIERRAQIPAVQAEPATPIAAAPESAKVQPAPLPEPTPPNSVQLPVQLTRFFGRDAEIGRLLDMMRSPEMRFVTLTGPGGSGKTRLCLEAMRRFAADFDGTIYFAALADLQDASLLPEAILDSIKGRGVAGSPSASSLEKVIEVLSEKPTLLLLDNFEQLVNEGASYVRTLVESVPDLRVLVTSRQRLGVRGEREFVLLPLPTPRQQATTTATPEELEQYVSVQLFVDRASAVRPDFELTPANAPLVGQLCRRLDGIPLAIELAAARSKVLAPAQMLARLENSLDLLATGHKDVENRHRSLRATMEWSINLLPNDVRTFWTKLGVFRGGWTLEAAEEVCDEPFALEWLEQLHEASLVLSEEITGGELRFRLLETLREYALEQIDPATRADMEERYARNFENLAHEALPELSGPKQASWLRHIEVEQDNFRAVLGYLLNHAPVRALALAADLCAFWETRGHFVEGRNWVERALERCQLESIEDHMLARLQRSAGWLAYCATDFAVARDHYEGALEIFRRLGDKRGQVESLTGLGFLAAIDSDVEQMNRVVTEALAHIRVMENASDKAAVLPMLSNIGFIVVQFGQTEIGSSANTEVIALARSVGDVLSLAKGLTNQASIETIHGNFAAARVYLDEALPLFDDLNDPFFGSYAKWHQGNAEARDGNFVAARRAYSESAAICRQANIKLGYFYLLESFAQLDLAQNNPSRGVVLFSTASRLRDENNAPPPPFVAPILEATLTELRAQTTPEQFEELWSKGQKLSGEEALDLALEDGHTPGGRPPSTKTSNFSPQLPKSSPGSPTNQSGEASSATPFSIFDSTTDETNIRIVVRALCGAGRLACFTGDFEPSLKYLNRSLRLGKLLGDDLEVARALNGLGLVAILSGEFAEARANFDEALRLCRLHNDSSGILFTIVNLGYMIVDFNALPEIIAMFEDGLKLARSAGNRRSMALMLTNLGMLFGFDGQIERGIPLLEESIELTREVGERWNEGRAEWALSQAILWPLADMEDSPERLRLTSSSRHHINLALQAVRVIKGRWEVSYLSEGCAMLNICEGNMEQAAHYWGVAESLRKRFGWTRSPITQPLYDRFLDIAKSQMGEKEFEAAMIPGITQGEVVSLDDASSIFPATLLH